VLFPTAPLRPLADRLLARVTGGTAVAPLAPAHADEAGEVAGITYRVWGSGPPLVLLPLALAASQWDPLLPALTAGYATVALGGARLWPMTTLEQRARGGYGAVVRALIAEVAPRPGERLLEAGCGSPLRPDRKAKIEAFPTAGATGAGAPTRAPTGASAPPASPTSGWARSSGRPTPIRATRTSGGVS
jgi:hypothetical protein